ncbi:hypothetical protein OOJ91_13840 [Micromonospora lupini]|nr:hypothetical protein [Micromonospora lupini]MCX5066929.1 hypothetical protein [Micromonospora lupini]
MTDDGVRAAVIRHLVPLLIRARRIRPRRARLLAVKLRRHR